MPTVSCPTCQRPVEWSDASPFRPFCSERCKLIDLGAWITEKHVIPGEEISPSADDDGSGERPLPT
jgi:endogenous inhibitor of DNA gyrase (YacG/DUF329 family)